MLGHGFGDRKLRLCGYVVGNRGNGFVRWRLYSFRRGECDCHRNIDPGFHQIRFSACGGGKPAADFNELFPDFRHCGRSSADAHDYRNEFPCHVVGYI